MSVQFVLDRLVLVCGLQTGAYSLKTILNYSIPEFPQLKDIATKLKKDGYVQNLVCDEEQSDIKFELTLKGKEYYQWKKRA